MPSQLWFEKPTNYEITILGALRQGWEDWFDGLTISHVTDENGNVMTRLSGTVDRSALHGILSKIFGLNLKLYSVTLMEQEGTTNNEAIQDD